MTKIETIRAEHAKTGFTGIQLKKHCERSIKGFHATENSYYPSVFNNGYAKKKEPAISKVIVDHLDDFNSMTLEHLPQRMNSEPALISALRELANVIGKDRVHSIVDSL